VRWLLASKNDLHVMSPAVVQKRNRAGIDRRAV
jgi:hypothetical protein